MDCDQKDRIRKDINASMKALNPGLPTVSIPVRRTFEFTSSGAQYKVMMAKSWCQFLRINDSHPMHNIRPQYIQIFEYIKRHLSNLDNWYMESVDEWNKHIGAPYSTDLIVQWYFHALHLYYAGARTRASVSDIYYFNTTK
eukprot:68596_1